MRTESLETIGFMESIYECMDGRQIIRAAVTGGRYNDSINPSDLHEMSS
jgi:hypothetical protein